MLTTWKITKKKKYYRSWNFKNIHIAANCLEIANTVDYISKYCFYIFFYHTNLQTKNCIKFIDCFLCFLLTEIKKNIFKISSHYIFCETHVFILISVNFRLLTWNMVLYFRIKKNISNNDSIFYFHILKNVIKEK